MLPDFAELKEKLEALAKRRLRQYVRRRDPVIREIRHMYIHEGTGSRYRTMDGTEDRMELKPSVAELRATPDEILDWSLEDVLKRIDGLGEQMLAQIVPAMFGKVKEATNRTGNVVDAGGQPFSFEVFIAGIEKVWIDFDDETGEPHLPTIVVPPGVAERLRTILPEWEKNEDYKRRFSEVIETKRQAWNDRESRRKLVD